MKNATDFQLDQIVLNIFETIGAEKVFSIYLEALQENISETEEDIKDELDFIRINQDLDDFNLEESYKEAKFFKSLKKEQLKMEKLIKTVIIQQQKLK